MSKAAIVVMLVMTGWAALSDLRTGLIPNRVVGFGALAGALALLVLALPGGAPGLGEAVLRMASGAALCSLLPGLGFALGALGGGDLKLFAAIGLCVGPWMGLDIQVGACLLALGYLPVLLTRQGKLAATLRNSGMLVGQLFLPAHRRRPVPSSELTSVRFGPAIFASALLVVVARGVLP